MKLIITIIFFILSLSNFAQDRLDEFIIGKTSVLIIEKIEREIGINCETSNDLDFYNTSIMNEKKNILFCEILLDEKCLELKLFYISQYDIEDIRLNDVYLFFYNDILIQIVCNKSQKIEELFTKKYGNPLKTEKITLNIQSSEMQYDEKIVELRWKKGNIKAISCINTQFFDNIPRDAGSYFTIYDIEKKKIIKDCNNFKK